MKRRAKKVFDSEFRVDGDFIHFDTAIGYDFITEFDPFLLFDMYGENKQPDQRVFHNPYHAHRGMETITYIRKGEATHKELDGEEYSANPGEAILMTAGNGLIHEERTVKKDGLVSGIQVWVNLAKKDKLVEPKYSVGTVGEVEVNGNRVQVVVGELDGVKGLSSDYNDIQMYELTMKKDTLFSKDVNVDKTVFIYVYQGEVISEGRKIKEKQVGLFVEGDEIELFASSDATVFYFEATPHKEKIAWGGTLSMNEDSELEAASDEILKGTFGKKRS